MILFTAIRIGVFVIAALSPLLTFAALWQTKEWRIDRLFEHFRATGFWRQTKGIIRPIIVLVGIAATIVVPVKVLAADATLLTLAGLSFLQIISRRQRYPVRTGKTVILLGLALLLNTAIALLITNVLAAATSLALSIVILIQLDILGVAWLLFYPVDRLAKRSILRRAGALRAKYTHSTAIGITGSVGKTTTKELIAHVLQSDTTLCTPAYVNSEIGVAKWLLQELPKFDPDESLTLVVEMGAYKAGEIRTMCNMVTPSIGVITYIGTQHIALFGGQQKLLNAKAELIEQLPKSGTALLNADNDFCPELQQKTHANVITVGTGGHADIEAYEIEETGQGIRFRVNDTMFSVPLHGTHNVTNVLLAIGVCQVVGKAMPDIAQSLQHFTPLSQTFNVRSEHGVTILDDTHNASAASFRAAIAWAKAQPMTPKILLTPGLIELGNERQRIHKDLGLLAAEVFDRIICTDKRAAAMLADSHNKTPEIYTQNIAPVPTNSLLVCVGRTSPAIITKLLP